MSMGGTYELNAPGGGRSFAPLEEAMQLPILDRPSDHSAIALRHLLITAVVLSGGAYLWHQLLVLSVHQFISSGLFLVGLATFAFLAAGRPQP